MPRKVPGVVDFLPFQHFCERRSADERGRASIGEEAGGFNASVIYAQTQTQTIAANRISLFGDGIRIREFAGVARIREMVFEDV